MNAELDTLMIDLDDLGVYNVMYVAVELYKKGWRLTTDDDKQAGLEKQEE